MQFHFARRVEDLEDPVEEIKRIIDHTNLKPEASISELEKTCRETVEHGFFACVVPLFFVEKAKHIVGDQTKVATVIGFPHGNSLPEVKEMETKKAFENGADEVDAVINVSLVKSGNIDGAVEEMKRLLEVVQTYGGTLKVIIETAFLDNATIFRVSQALARIGVHFVKTSTGFAPRGATPEDIIVMREAVKGTNTRIKAAGGIRTGLQALYFYLLGVDRIGTSSSIQIVNDLRRLNKPII